MGGWIAVAAGFAVFATAAYKAASGAEDSAVDTPWYVPDAAEAYINEEVARIQQEQKGRVENALMKAFGKGALVMVGVGLAFGAYRVGTSGARRSSR